MARKLGSDRVRFIKAHIQDLAEDLERLEAHLKDHPVTSFQSLGDLESWREQQRRLMPAVAEASIDVVISNCVLNLVRREDREKLLKEVLRVLKPGGRVAISDVISDEPIPMALQHDEQLWADCLTGAFQESEFIEAFAKAGFVAMRYSAWQSAPWRVIDGIEFRTATLLAVKPTGTECLDRGQAVIYRGPYAQVIDDEGHVFARGQRMAVCERTFEFITTGQWNEDFIRVPSSVDTPPVPWCAPPGTRRSAKETKSGRVEVACGPGTGCC
jgi:arsenite methyltransferase